MQHIRLDNYDLLWQWFPVGAKKATNLPWGPTSSQSEHTPLLKLQSGIHFSFRHFDLQLQLYRLIPEIQWAATCHTDH